MADGEKSESIAAPMLLAAGVIVLVLAMFGGLAIYKPLDYKPVPVTHCEGEGCAHEGAPPVSGEHEAPPASGAHEAAPAPHGE